MKTMWTLQDAKTNFSKLVSDAINIEPQFITQNGQKTVVVISVDEYEKLISPKQSFKEFLLNCPKLDDGFEFERQKF